MSRNPRSILQNLVAFARQFRYHEERLLDPVHPDNPFPIDERVFLIEQGFSGAAYGFFRSFGEYKARVAELPHNPFSLPLRRAIEAFPGLIENRFHRWGWDLSILTPEGFARLCERCKADQEARERAVDEVAVSWRTLGKNLATHHGADRAAFAAEQRGVKPTMTPEEGERAYHQRVEELWMKPMIGHAVPEVSLDEHDQLCSAVNELERLARREWLFSTFTLGNPYSKDAEEVSLSELERAEGRETFEQPRDETRLSTKADGSGDARRTSSRRPKASNLDDLTSTAWKLLRAVRDKGAISSEKAVGRDAIAAKARVGNHDSKHNQYAFGQLADLQLIIAKRKVGTWITDAGIRALNKRSISG
jgi:hypothetical protein